MGSTRCFLLSLQGEDKKNTEFISLEVNFEKNQIAKENLKELLNDDNKKLEGDCIHSSESRVFHI